MTLALRFASLSHVGMVRDGNEDSSYAGPRVLAVADGMGGHAAGEVASAIAIAAISQLDEEEPGADLLDALAGAADAANTHLHDMVEGDTALDGMGTTLTSLLFAGTRLGLLHIGDSRAYLLRDGELSQITKDHTLVQTLVDEGRITEEQASTHPQRSLITQALDGRSTIDPDLSVREARAGDRYLLCTDGLTGPVGQLSTLREALLIEDLEASCERLVQLALRGGGPDNVTVIVADVVDGAAPGNAAPVIAGAAATAPQPAPPGVADTPAGRARAAQGRDRDGSSARTAAPPLPHDEHLVEDDTDDTYDAVAAPRRGRGRRLALVLALAVLTLGLSAGAGWAYLREQYYVGADGDQVAVFRGVRGTLAGVPLSSVEEVTPLETARLDEEARADVEEGIVAQDRSHAGAIVERLTDRAVQDCLQEQPAPAPTLPPAPATPPPATASPPPAGAPSPPFPTFIPAPSPSPVPSPVPSACAALAS